MTARNYNNVVDLLIRYWKHETLDVSDRRSCWQLARKVETKLQGVVDPADLKRRPEAYRDLLYETLGALAQTDVASRELLQSLINEQNKNDGAERISQKVNFDGDGNKVNVAGRDVIINHSCSQSRHSDVVGPERNPPAVKVGGSSNSAGPRIFICYSWDDESKARELYLRLKADGFSPWMDKEDLLPGQEWGNVITKTVENADAFIALLSNNSIDKRGVVQKEIRLALDVADKMPEGKAFIIPMKLEECEIPPRLSKWHCEYFDEMGYKKLVKLLKRLSAGGPGFKAESRPQWRPAPPPQTENAVNEAITSMPTEQKLTPWNYMAVSFVGLLIAVALLLLFIYEAPRLVNDGIDGKVFYVLLVPLGLASAAFVFGGMKSYARFFGKVFSGTLELGGAAVIAALVVIGGFQLVPEARTFNITVRVFDQDGSPVKYGDITIYLEQDGRRSPIAANGEANFKEIPLKFRNLTTKVLVDVKGYKLSGPQTISLSQSVIEIKVARDKAALLEEIRSIENDYIGRINRATQSLSGSAANYLNCRRRLVDVVKLHNADLEAYRRMSEVYRRWGGVITKTPDPPDPPDYATMRADLNKAASDLNRDYQYFQAEIKRLSDEFKQKMAGFQAYGINENSDLPVALDEEINKALNLLPSTDEFFKMRIVGGVG